MKSIEKSEVCDTSRRQLLKKTYMAPVVIALGTLTSQAEAYKDRKCNSSSLHRDNGWGNGDDYAPGKSGPHNNAENDFGWKIHSKYGTSNPN